LLHETITFPEKAEALGGVGWLRVALGLLNGNAEELVGAKGIFQKNGTVCVSPEESVTLKTVANPLYSKC